MRTRILSFVFLLFTCAAAAQLTAQPDRWQQRVVYDMDIDVDADNHQYTGNQQLTYFNNSPDTLDKVFYHLYFNAFQPGSQMDLRNLNLPDADKRVSDRISNLQAEEEGYIQVNSLTREGSELTYETVGTILEVALAEPIYPGDSARFTMEWDAQVPLQIRRSGRDNAEGIDLSMAQWYPKLAEYDYQGWHANPYIGREFYGVWGDYDVTIDIDEAYVVAATGYQQGEPESIDGGKQRYRFIAPTVHDFVWAADPDYEHIAYDRGNGTTLNFYFQPGEATSENWENLPRIMDEAFAYIGEHYGPYPYEQYSFIQGGDGGMEYPMATLITGERSMNSLVGVSVHELMHTWYQMLMGTNESLYAWMDEGFTSWASSEVMNHLREQGLIEGEVTDNPHARTYASLRGFRTTGMQEPLSVHADHFATNSAYSVASYTNGAVFLEQLRYIIGEDAFECTLHRYYNDWRFKHPNSNDFTRVAEKCSGLELDWYREYWVNGTEYADYAVTDVEDLDASGTTRIDLQRVGRMPMPLEVSVTLKDGTETYYYIAPEILRGEKPQPAYASEWNVLPDWGWTNPNYSFTIETNKQQIEKVTINARERMFEDDLQNNGWED
ncbi:peptidase M1-like protein [Neolewinella xylanilytica]|uniref:Peptidase M1-like protein n=1 Tax=Neolewinella xylanilytica TaxID=1514080 RepID=A0A2S6I5E9_9BACT|nr:M1 family metallopeptidase [Neolewinella xylanilytica]PPK86375.1 peptidase M1-like protein [Neolewinella xylanilytica]